MRSPGEAYTPPYGLYSMQNPGDGHAVTRDTWLLYPKNKLLSEGVERFVDFVLRDRKRVEAEIRESVDASV